MLESHQCREEVLSRFLCPHSSQTKISVLMDGLITLRGWCSVLKQGYNSTVSSLRYPLKAKGFGLSFRPRRRQFGRRCPNRRCLARIGRRGSVQCFSTESPQGCWKLADGANHRFNISKKVSPAGAAESTSMYFHSPCRGCMLVTEVRWLAPPANLRQPSGLRR
jgi:hypothetical protein